MGMNDTPQAERVHIGIFGRTNAGKSSLFNLLTGQELAVVSEVSGTTTDPVRKSMELLPIGAVVMIDTPGLDDDGNIGEKRVKQAYSCMNETDIAIVVTDAKGGFHVQEKDVIVTLKKRNIPYIVVVQKSDLLDDARKQELLEAYMQMADGMLDKQKEAPIFVSAMQKQGREALMEALSLRYSQQEMPDRPMIRDLIAPFEHVILVIPIDEAAPKGRIILPQQLALRELLECGAIISVVKPSELLGVLKAVPKPACVITDSQAFGEVSKIVPPDVYLTSFSILMARKKGTFEMALAATDALDHLQDGSRVMISEGCSHKRQCGDIGTVKLPKWIEAYTGKNISFSYTQGKEFPENVREYDLIVHCGACMLGEKEVNSRYEKASEQEVPMTNYGLVIAKTHGILTRSVEILNRNRPV